MSEDAKHFVESHMLPPGAKPTLIYLEGFLAALNFTAAELWRGKFLFNVPLVQPEMERKIKILEVYIAAQGRAKEARRLIHRRVCRALRRGRRQGMMRAMYKLAISGDGVEVVRDIEAHQAAIIMSLLMSNDYALANQTPTATMRRGTKEVVVKAPKTPKEPKQPKVRREPSPQRSERAEQIRALIKEGQMKDYEIALKVGCSNSTVSVIRTAMKRDGELPR